MEQPSLSWWNVIEASTAVIFAGTSFFIFQNCLNINAGLYVNSFLFGNSVCQLFVWIET